MPSPSHTRRTLLAILFALAMLNGCTSAPQFEPVTPTSVDLSGSWLRNEALSDDPVQALEAMRGKRAGRNQRRGLDRDTMLAMIKGGNQLLISQRADALGISVDGTGEQVFRYGENISQINESGVATLTSGWAQQTFNIARWAKRGPNVTQQLRRDAVSGRLRHEIHLQIKGVGETTVVHWYDRTSP